MLRCITGLIVIGWIACLSQTTVAKEEGPLLCTKSKLIFEESFSTDQLDSRWSAAKGDWSVSQGALTGTELKKDQHAASIRTNVELPDTLILQFDFRFDGGTTIHCSFNGKGHICRATITPKGFTLKGEKVKKDPQDKTVTVGQVQQEFVVGTWYTMQIEIAGEEIVARVNDGPVAFGADKKIARKKTNFGFPMAGASSQIDNIKIWSANPNPTWVTTKAKLPINKITPSKPVTPQQRFSNMDRDQDGNLSLAEFIGKRPQNKHETAKKQFSRKDRDNSGSLTLSEFLPSDQNDN